MSQPHDSGAHATSEAVGAVALAIRGADFQRAGDLAEAALARGLIHPAFFSARALCLERHGRDAEALLSYQQARALAPKDARLLNAIGLCQMRLQRLDEALESFEEALRIEPANAVTHQRKGVALGWVGRTDQAERAHRRAVQLQPGNADALASLASIAARKGDEQAAEELAVRALKLDERNATAHVALTLIELSREQFTAAEHRLRPLLDDRRTHAHAKAVAYGLLGDALDGQDRTEEAFAAYAKANEEQQRLHAPRLQKNAAAPALLDMLIGHYQRVDPQSSEPASDDSEKQNRAEHHVFLLGFHRSGTTVLEQALECHDEIVTLEEQDFLADMATRYLTTETGLEQLRVLGPAARSEARMQYWQRVRSHGVEFRGKTFVDKNPLNTVKLPLISRLFPESRILFAVRDPRDVVLSCFRRQFEVDLVKLEFLSLEGAANLYDRTMRFAELCRTRLPLAVHEHRYEDMISDFDGRLQAVCAFVGVPWRASMHDFAAVARGQDIRSPSAGQVRRGLYAEGVGQWRRYEKHLAPVLPILRPWIDRFGYERE